MEGNLGERLASLDAARFVGRAAELRRLDAALGGDGGAQIVIVSGPAGVGKSALLRAGARSARARGYPTVVLDARDLTPSPDSIASSLTSVREASRPCVVLDSWERMAALDGFLRGELLPTLPRDAVLLIGTRRRPSADWFRGGWENLVLDLPLAPLDDAEADALLRARGVIDREDRSRLIAWAAGSPLALVLAADRVLPDAPSPGADPLVDLDEPLRRILDARPDGEESDVLAVASLAHVTTPELLHAALPEIDAEKAFAWLREHPCAEPATGGVMLHALVARLIRAELARRAPELERELRRRLVDVLYARAMAGGFLDFARDLQHLVHDHTILWGFAWDSTGRYLVDGPRSGDLDAIATRSGRTGLAWLRAARPYFEDAPNRVSVVRGRQGDVCGYGIVMSPANAPLFAWKDALVGPWLEDAADRFPDGAAVICRQAIDLTGSVASPVTALLGMAGVLSAGLGNPRGAYLPIAAADRSGHAFTRALGGKAIPTLATEHEGVQVECHVLDYSDGGIITAQRDMIYRELGLEPPAPEPPPTLETVRGALRDYASATPRKGASGAVRACARERIDEAIDRAFGQSPRERRLRQVLVRAYIEPAPTHELAALELNLSRSAYFRALKAAVARVAVQLGASVPTPATGVRPEWDAHATDSGASRP